MCPSTHIPLSDPIPSIHSFKLWSPSSTFLYHLINHLIREKRKFLSLTYIFVVILLWYLTLFLLKTIFPSFLLLSIVHRQLIPLLISSLSIFHIATTTTLEFSASDFFFLHFTTLHDASNPPPCFIEKLVIFSLCYSFRFLST